MLALRVHQTYDAIVDACCHAWNDLMATPDRIASITARQWAVMSHDLCGLVLHRRAEFGLSAASGEWLER